MQTYSLASLTKKTVRCSNKPLFHYYLPGLKESMMNYLLQQKSLIIPAFVVVGPGEISNFKLVKDLMKVAEYIAFIGL